MGTKNVATEIANAIEAVLVGCETEAVVYALSMVIAHLVAAGERPDLDATMKTLRVCVLHELKRQFPHAITAA